ncbi:MAG: ABC transporter permease [Phycisphaerales bacterium]|jgi:ABC-type dipeptide/oligopeptide/nickel transport system permease subunit|nr:ABC transporter permease [Phycisphaeraceae bacterium]
MPPSTPQPAPAKLERVTGVQLMQGIGHVPAKGFWADAFSQVLKRPTAVFAIVWLCIVAFFGVYAPLLASGYPLILRQNDQTSFPLFDQLEALDILLLVWVTAGGLYTFFGPRATIATRAWSVIAGLIAAIAMLAVASYVQSYIGNAARDTLADLSTQAKRTGQPVESVSLFVDQPGAGYIVGAVVSIIVGALMLLAPYGQMVRRVVVLSLAGVLVAYSSGVTWQQTPGSFDAASRVYRGDATGTWTVLPWSPMQRFSELSRKPPGASRWIGAIEESTRTLPRGVPLTPALEVELNAKVNRALPLLPEAVRADLSFRWSQATKQGATRREIAEYARLAGEAIGPAGLPPEVLTSFTLLRQSLPLNADEVESIRDELAAALERTGAPLPVRERAGEALTRARERAATAGSPPLSRAELIDLIDAPLGPTFPLGTDKDGADVLSQLLHASRLSISIGFVSTSIALVIGVTIGAIMGYFGGWIDIMLYRVVEVFMAVPLLFLLIVAASVLPSEFRSTYWTMAIIGMFSWTGMARFTRAEFMKLRNQDFVQAAQASGLSLRSVLFRHMLPNGVAPVLVDTSFAIAAAISIEATLSYLGLGPVDSASWGKLLSSAISSEGEFKWWLAVFPGGAIFLTVLAYNFIGEALRDAIDPKLKKARV